MRGRAELREYLMEYEDTAIFAVGLGGMLGGAVGYMISAKNICSSLLTNATKVVYYMPKTVFPYEYIYQGATTIKTSLLGCAYYGEPTASTVNYVMTSQCMISALRTFVDNTRDRADAQQLAHATKIVMDLCQSQLTKDNLIAGGYGIGALLGVIFTIYHIYRDNQYLALQNAQHSAQPVNTVTESFMEVEQTEVMVRLPAKAVNIIDENAKADESFINEIIQRLNNYRDSISEGDREYSFKYFAFMQAPNRQANYELAGELITQLRNCLTENRIANFQELFSPESIADLRKDTWSFTNSINSQELNAIISHVLRYKSNAASTTSIAPKTY